MGFVNPPNLSVAKVPVKTGWNAADLSPSRFFAAEPQPIEFIIPGLLARGIVGFLFGEGGAFKSLGALWLVMQRAAAGVTTDAKWFGKFPVTAGRSMFMSAEDVEADLHHRVLAITNAIYSDDFNATEDEIKKAISENCLIVSREQWCLGDELFLVDENGRSTVKTEQIISICNEFKADLIILETYSRIANVDEIDNNMAARAVGVLEEIRDKTGASVVVVAHSSKVSRFTRTDIHGQNGLRGAGALLDNARWGVWFRAAKSDDGSQFIEVENAKNFRCKRFEPFSVKADYPRLVAVDRKPSDAFSLVVDDVREHPGTKQRETRDRLGLRRTVINAAFKDAEMEGMVELKGPRNKPDGYFYVE